MNITGPGYSAALDLASSGSRVILACGNAVGGRAAAEAIRREVPNADVEFLKLDLASTQSVRRCARRILAAEKRYQRQIRLLVGFEA